MPSLRRSLILYFLLLLVVGLGAVGLLADQVIGRALAEKETSAATLIDTTAKDRVEEEAAKFDADLLNHARVVARTAGSEYWGQLAAANLRLTVYQDLPTVGLLAAGLLEPNGWVSAASWRMTAHSPLPTRRGPPLPPGPAVAPLGQVAFANLKLDEYLIGHLDDDVKGGDHIQIQTSRNNIIIWRSPNLGAFTMPFDRSKWDMEKDHWRYEDLDLPTGPARRVTFMTTPTGVRGMMTWAAPASFAQPPRDGGPPTAPSRDGVVGPPPNQARFDPQPWFPRNFIHVARLTAPRDAALKEILENAEADKAALVADTAATRGGVRTALALSGLAAFAGMMIGGWLVIGFGLHPLRKLSDAVSRVSEKDFHLPVEKEELTQELVPIHDRLTQSLAALKVAFEREKEAVADISHELRTPVAGLLATIDVSLRKPRTAEQYRQTLEDCRGITKQLSRLVERVMTLAYLDAGQAAVNAEPTDAAELASGCAAVIRPLAESHGLRFTTDLHPPTELTTDADKLREVMMNLLHNAVEYNKPGGAVNIRVRGEPTGKRVVLEVSDTGIGMTPEVRGMIFERFYRADPSRTATGVHAGLGLAIVKEYVDRLGGTISVESEQDRGSTFRVTLPA